MRLTICIALIVVSSMDAAWQPSSVEPPSHIPANAAILLLTKEKNRIKVLRALAGQQSLSVGWENDPEQGLKTASFNPLYTE